MENGKILSIKITDIALSNGDKETHTIIIARKRMVKNAQQAVLLLR